jgi:hypothetical protein
MVFARIGGRGNWCRGCLAPGPKSIDLTHKGISYPVIVKFSTAARSLKKVFYNTEISD